MCKVKGFTLVELMVTIAIAAILLIIAAPSLNNLYQATRAEMATKKLHQLIQFARSQAVSTEQNVTICHLENNACNDNWSDGITVFIDLNANNRLDAEDIELEHIDIINDKDEIKVNARGRFQFNANGRVGRGGTVAYCPEDYENVPSKQIVISGPGRISSRNLNINKCK